MTWLIQRYASPLRAAEGGSAGTAGAGDGGGAGAGAQGAGAGQQGKPWYDGLPPEIVGHWDNKGLKKDDPKALASELTQHWKSLEKHFGAPADQILKLPKDTSDAAAMAEVYQRLGAPKDAKGYDFTTVKRADGTELDAALADKMRAALLTAGVGKDRALDIVKAVVAHDDAIATAKSAERAAMITREKAALDAEWGPHAEFNRLTAMQGANRLGISPEEVAKMEGVIGYKRTMEFFQRIGASTSEDTFVSGGQGGRVTTRAGAQARLAELERDADWGARLARGDAKATQEMNDLISAIHGAAA